jgi:hypothetical protein
MNTEKAVEKMFDVICVEDVDREEILTCEKTYPVFDTKDASGMNDIYYLTTLDTGELGWVYSARFTTL